LRIRLHPAVEKLDLNQACETFGSESRRGFASKLTSVMHTKLKRTLQGPIPLITMTKLMLTLAAALVMAGDARAETKWKLVWSDEFDTAGRPDPTRWTNETGFIRNREQQYYTAGRSENSRVESGRLIIEARKERFPNARHTPGSTNWQRADHAEYTSASLTTRGRAEWRRGRVEVRAKLPRGRGVWPAIWMLGVDREREGWPRCGEIDIMEYVGFDPHVIHANIHTAKYNHVRGTGKGSRLGVEAPFDGLHIYALEWHSDRLDFFVDEKKYFTYAKEKDAKEDAWPFDQPCYLILNLAIGGAWGGQRGIDETIFPQRFEIDYVRVYQHAE
jgi:beta-glucanase (GH16 family)